MTSPLKEHHKRSTPQQRLIRATFATYKTKCEDKRYPMHIDGVDVLGDDVLFQGGNLGAHVGFSVWELAEFIQHLEAKHHDLYKPCETRFFIYLNNHNWEAFATDTMEACVKRVDDHYEAERVAYEASPRYIEDLAKAAAEEAANFTRCNHVAYSLDMGFDLYDVASWVVTFVEVADCRGALTQTDATHVFRRFQVMNYTVSDGVGTDPQTFEERVRYIVGQVMNYCQKGMTPHPMLREWAQKAIKDYLEASNGEPTGKA